MDDTRQFYLGDGTDAPTFLNGGGDMGRIMREKDWTKHDFGHPADWPQELKTMVRIMLTSKQPMEILWGAKLHCLYNDAFEDLFDFGRDLESIGQEGRILWADVWKTVGDQLERVISDGKAFTSEDALIPLKVDGVWEDRYWMYSYSPITGETDPTEVKGIFVTCQDRTRAIKHGKAETAAKKRAEIALLETHHRVKNNLAVLKGLVRAESRKASEEAVHKALERLTARIDSVMRLYEAMLFQSEGGEVDARNYIERLSHDIHELMSHEDKDVQLEVTCAPLNLEVDQTVQLGVILVELLTNAHKHAFVGRKTGMIYVSLEQTATSVSMIVKDEAGHEEIEEVNAQKSTGIGRVVLEAAVAQLSGDLETAQEPEGRTIKISFPFSVDA